MSISQLGDYLVKKGKLSPDDRETIIRECGRQSQAFAKSVVALGILGQEELVELLLEKHGMIMADPTDLENPDPEAIATIDLPILRYLEVFPFKFEEKSLLVAMADPMDIDTIEQIKFITNWDIKPVVTTIELLESCLTEVFGEFTLAESPLQRFMEKFGRPIEGATHVQPSPKPIRETPEIAMEFEEEEEEEEEEDGQHFAHSPTPETPDSSLLGGPTNLVPDDDFEQHALDNIFGGEQPEKEEEKEEDLDDLAALHSDDGDQLDTSADESHLGLDEAEASSTKENDAEVEFAEDTEVEIEFEVSDDSDEIVQTSGDEIDFEEDIDLDAELDEIELDGFSGEEGIEDVKYDLATNDIGDQSPEKKIEPELDEIAIQQKNEIIKEPKNSMNVNSIDNKADSSSLENLGSDYNIDLDGSDSLNDLDIELEKQITLEETEPIDELNSPEMNPSAEPASDLGEKVDLENRSYLNEVHPKTFVNEENFDHTFEENTELENLDIELDEDIGLDLESDGNSDHEKPTDNVSHKDPNTENTHKMNLNPLNENTSATEEKSLSTEIDIEASEENIDSEINVDHMLESYDHDSTETEDEGIQIEDEGIQIEDEGIQIEDEGIQIEDDMNNDEDAQTLLDLKQKEDNKLFEESSPKKLTDEVKNFDTDSNVELKSDKIIKDDSDVLNMAIEMEESNFDDEIVLDKSEEQNGSLESQIELTSTADLNHEKLKDDEDILMHNSEPNYEESLDRDVMLGSDEQVQENEEFGQFVNNTSSDAQPEEFSETRPHVQSHENTDVVHEEIISTTNQDVLNSAEDLQVENNKNTSEVPGPSFEENNPVKKQETGVDLDSDLKNLNSTSPVDLSHEKAHVNQKGTDEATELGTGENHREKQDENEVFGQQEDELSNASENFSSKKENSDQQKTRRDTASIETIDEDKKNMVQKKLATGFLNHAITRIQMTSSLKDSIQHASEGLIKSGSVFGLFIKEENAFEPVSMWLSSPNIEKPNNEDLENYAIEIGATKDNIDGTWTPFNLIIEKYKFLYPMVCKVISDNKTLYVVAYYKEKNLQQYLKKGTENLVKSLTKKF